MDTNRSNTTTRAELWSNVLLVPVLFVLIWGIRQMPVSPKLDEPLPTERYTLVWLPKEKKGAMEVLIDSSGKPLMTYATIGEARQAVRELGANRDSCVMILPVNIPTKPPP